MELRDLQALSALVKLGTTKSAALGIGVSQPTISRAVTQVEAHFGKQLFTRHRGRLFPTPDALRISKSVEEISVVLDFLHNDIGRKSDAKVLRVGAAGEFSHALLRPAMVQFVSMYPDISISVRRRDATSLMGELADGALDIGVSLTPEVGENVSVDQLVQGSFCCVLPRHHPLGQHECIEPAMLRNQTLIGTGIEGKAARLLDQALAEVEAAPGARRKLDVSCPRMSCQLVAAGAGVAVLPEHAELLRGWGETIQVRPFSPAFAWNLYGMTTRMGTMQQAAKQFCKIVRRNSTGLGEDGRKRQ